jgi:type IV pilus assembly protein PilC
MVAAGEETGNREEVFARLAGFLERDERFRKRLRAALFYPAIVVVCAMAIAVYLVTAVIPEFSTLFLNFGVQPAPVLIGLASIASLLTNPLAIATTASTLAIGSVLAIRYLHTSAGAFALDNARLRLPILGGALRKAVLARLCRVLSTMLESGVNLVRALEVAVPVTDSPVFAEAIDGARARIAGGQVASLDEALAGSELFGPLLLGFVRIGGAAGNVPNMLLKLAEYYEDDVESVLAVLPTILQTCVTVGLGAFVAAIVYVVYVPLSALSASIH